MKKAAVYPPSTYRSERLCFAFQCSWLQWLWQFQLHNLNSQQLLVSLLIFWVLDQFVHVLFILCIGKEQHWSKEVCQFLKNVRCSKFQIELGLNLLNYAIRLDWPDPTETKPTCMQSTVTENCATFVWRKWQMESTTTQGKCCDPSFWW